jgi:PAS domain S-box-containing protein
MIHELQEVPYTQTDTTKTMSAIPILQKNYRGSKKALDIDIDKYSFYQRALSSSLEPNIVSETKTGKIILANRAACALLGYLRKELLTKHRGDILDIDETRFNKMLKHRHSLPGHKVKVIKKCGKLIPCEITSRSFADDQGYKKTITSIHEICYTPLRQKNIDTRNEKIVADNISIAKLKQNKTDIRKDKIVKENIVLAQVGFDNRLAQQKNNFITIASHELKTPITCIKAYVQILQMDLDAGANADAAIMIGKINEQTDKLVSLVNNLFGRVTMQNGKLQHVR